MLSNTSIYEAQQLVQIAAKSGVGFTPVPLTPLESLAKASINAEIAININTDNIESFGSMLKQGSMTRSADGALDHDMAQADVIEMVAGVIARNLDLAKNVVNPVCLDVLSRVSSALESQVTRDINNVSILADYHREIWNSPILANLVDPFVEVAPEVISLRGIVPDLSDEAINELLVTGAGPLDSDIADVVANTAPGKVAAVYREIFARVVPNGRELADVLNPFGGDRDTILLVFLLARRLVDDVPEGTSVSLAEYRGYMAKIQAQAGFALNRIQALRKRDVANKTILRNYPAGGVEASNIPGAQITITVNGPVYNQWLSEGGKPEAILGAFITDSETRYDTLLAGLDGYVSAWNRHLAFKASFVADEKYSRIVSALRFILTQVINESEEGEGKPSKDVMRATLDAELQHVHHRDVDNFAHAVRKLVCRSMFAHTQAEAILMSMDRIAAQYPEMDVAEVALFATIDETVSWVATLIKVEK